MQVILYRMKCHPKEVDKYDFITPLMMFDGDSEEHEELPHFVGQEYWIKAETSILNIELVIPFENQDEDYIALVRRCNYVYINLFKRYYFVTDITADTAMRLHLKLAVDVMYTYRNKIITTDQYIERATSKYNGKYADTEYPITQQKEVYIKKGARIFSNQGSTSRCYSLTVVNGGSVPIS